MSKSALLKAKQFVEEEIKPFADARSGTIAMDLVLQKELDLGQEPDQKIASNGKYVFVWREERVNGKLRGEISVYKKIKLVSISLE